jgi:purine-cytosine permease-like protein
VQLARRTARDGSRYERRNVLNKDAHGMKMKKNNERSRICKHAFVWMSVQFTLASISTLYV